MILLFVVVRKLQFYNDNFYHIFNRGVRKSDIYINNRDYQRWEQLLYWCNNYDYSYGHYLFRLNQTIKNGSSIEQLNEILSKSKLIHPLVQIHAYVEMPNHFHLLLRQVQDRGIPKFMQKIATAYSMYFNLQKNFTGSVYEGNYKAVTISSEPQLLQVFRYIHLNPSEAGLISKNKLPDYQWSSLPIYISNKNDKIVTTDFFSGKFKDSKSIYNFIISSNDDSEAENISSLMLDIGR